MSTDLHIHFHGPITVQVSLPGILEAINQLKEFITMNNADAIASLQAATAQIQKVGDETRALIQKVADLTVLVEQQATVSPELAAAIDAVKAQVQVVDDLVPDVPVDPPPAG